jgi:hypothetical protein
MATRAEMSEAIALLRAEYQDMPTFDRTRVEMWWRALGTYPDGAILRSAERHLTTCKFKPQLADLVEGCRAQVDNQWLGPDEAWALMPKSELDSALLTSEMAEAMGVATPLLEMGDRVAARMAFRDAYMRLVEKAKIENRSPSYFPSWGTDKVQHAPLVANAVKRGQLTVDRAVEFLPEHATQVVRMAGITQHPLLAGPSETGRRAIKQLLQTVKAINHG